MERKRRNIKRHLASTKQKILKPIPKFKSLKAEAHFWDTHDTTEYAWEDLDETIEVAGPLKRRVEKRRAARLAALKKVKDYLIDKVGNMVQLAFRGQVENLDRISVDTPINFPIMQAREAAAQSKEIYNFVRERLELTPV